ncbi:MAG: nicotinate-nucleotide adenylyltransferase [Muribaculaceae bacterium]|nr:nicotinate-nucleotide adenylyltransferase [Muribaculaceae bacterium]
MRIAIFGGSFNPIHTGHALMAQTVAESGLADEVWMMVSPQNPWKDEANLMDEKKRMELVRLAVNEIPGVEASDFEFSLPKPSFTYATLRALQTAYPQHQFLLLIGSDNWNAFSKWRNWEEILSGFELLIYQRPDVPARGPFPEGVHLLDNVPQMMVSSTYIRRRIADGKSLRFLVPEAIREHLERKPE